MAAPGIQISEIWHALVRCKEIYKAFKKGNENAAEILANFQEDLQRVEQALEFHKFLYEKTGKQYPGAQSFKTVLNGCAEYLANHKQLLDRHAGQESFAGVYQTVVSVFKDDIPTFRVAISQKIQEFSDWKLNLLLEHAFARAEQPVAASSAQHTTDLNLERQYQADDQLRRDVNELVSIIYAHGRLLKSGHLSAARGRPHPGGVDSLTEAELNSQRLEARFSIAMSSICRRGNMPDDYRPRSVSLQELSSYVSSSRQEAMIQGFSGTARYPRHPAMIFPRSVRVRIWIEADERVFQLEASGYVFVGRQFIFFDASGRPLCEHRVGQECRPFTQRTIVQNETHERLVVEFLGPQELSVFQQEEHDLDPRGGGALMTRNQLLDVGRTKEETFQALPKYWFARRNHEEYMQFQSDLRGVRLSREYQVRTITSKRSASDPATDQVRVKLWSNDKNPDGSFLSSLAEFQSRTIFEWPLRWFEAPQKIDETVARLKFRLPPDQPPSPVLASGSRSSFANMGRVIARHARRSSANTIATVSNASSSAPSSIRSVDNLNYAPSSWLTKVEYLDLEFDAPKDVNDYNYVALNHRDDFVRDVRQLQATIHSPVPSALPSSAYESLFESPEISSFVSSPYTPGTSPDNVIAGSSNTRSTEPVERPATVLPRSPFVTRPLTSSSLPDALAMSLSNPPGTNRTEPHISSPYFAEDISAGVTPATPSTYLGQGASRPAVSPAPVPNVATPQTYLHPGR